MNENTRMRIKGRKYKINLLDIKGFQRKTHLFLPHFHPSSPLIPFPPIRVFQKKLLNIVQKLHQKL